MNLSTAMAEGLNGKIQELKTVGKGYRACANFRSAILFFHGGLGLYPNQLKGSTTFFIYTTS
jgi:hypothetical protein